jgi:threonine/homoserine/homoserine lactone efflux protein
MFAAILENELDYIPNPLIIPIGLIIGVLVAAPVGPVNILCIQRAIERGFWGGVAAGLGSVLGDGLIALFASLGVGAVTGAVQNHRTIIQTVGGIALLAFGVKLFVTKPRLVMPVPGAEETASLKDFVWDIPQTFFFTITNPGAVLGLFAIFGGVSTFVEVDGYIDSLVMVAAIMAGSLAWWIFLSNMIGRVRHRITAARFKIINQVAGALLGAFGIVLVGEMIFKNRLLF